MPKKNTQLSISSIKFWNPVKISQNILNDDLIAYSKSFYQIILSSSRNETFDGSNTIGI